MNRNVLTVVAALLVIGGGWLWDSGAATLGGQQCTMDAKMCPDGSSVGRTGPNCEFAECPSTEGYATLQGVVTLGPTCPVETTPPDPNCAGKTYQTILTVRSITDGTSISVPTDETGSYMIKVKADSYMLSASGGDPLPFCKEVSAQVAGNEIKTVDISCDTGIR